MKYTNITASAVIKAKEGVLRGMYVNSTSAGTIEFNDGITSVASAGVKATGTLTASDVFANGDTITIGDSVYTMKTALLTYDDPNSVLIGVSAAVSLDNLKSAINGTAGVGSTYGFGTIANEQVRATTNTDTTQVVEAILIGTAGNAIATTETGDDSAWGAVVLENGLGTNTLVNGVITPAIGYHELGDADFNYGLYATIANTLDVTLYFD